ncbi:MAG: hypothetical protein LBS76_03770 [Mycoplasmataceae bacterium]|jgi:hypothetical protein|nr:hypothetical protein [Mycoplasmataceae bacterium]
MEKQKIKKTFLVDTRIDYSVVYDLKEITQWCKEDKEWLKEHEIESPEEISSDILEDYARELLCNDDNFFDFDDFDLEWNAETTDEDITIWSEANVTYEIKAESAKEAKHEAICSIEEEVLDAGASDIGEGEVLSCKVVKTKK